MENIIIGVAIGLIPMLVVLIIQYSRHRTKQKEHAKEIARIQVYQKAVDRLKVNRTGFGAAWQAALKESEDEFEKT